MTTFSVGTRVYIDGEDEAIVKAYFPKGSSSYLFPHYKVDMVNGDRNVAISAKRCFAEKGSRAMVFTRRTPR